MLFSFCQEKNEKMLHFLLDKIVSLTYNRKGVFLSVKIFLFLNPGFPAFAGTSSPGQALSGTGFGFFERR